MARDRSVGVASRPRADARFVRGGRVWRFPPDHHGQHGAPAYSAFSPGRSRGAAELPKQGSVLNKKLEVMPPNVEEEGCITEVFNYLWSKHPATGKSCKHVRLPDTILYKYRQPAYWYFTDGQGEIRRKKHTSVTNQAIYERLMSKASDRPRDAKEAEPIVAVYIYTKKEIPQQNSAVAGGSDATAGGERERTDRSRAADVERTTVVEHFSASQLHTFLFNREKLHNGVLQEFIQPKSGHNSTLCVNWSPQVDCTRNRRADGV